MTLLSNILTDEAVWSDPDWVKDLEACSKESDLLWIEDNCRIVDKLGNLVPLIANEAQMRLQAVIEKRKEAGLPVRVIILKARQMGITTWVQGWIFCQCNKKPNRRALTSAHKDEASRIIFEKIKMYQKQIPQQLPMEYSNRKEIIYTDPHRSKIQVATAGSEDLGRSDTIHYFHGSEAAMWPNAKKSFLAVLQCIPRSNPDTAVFVESTADGVGGEFYERCQAAMNGESDYDFLFLPWWMFAEYRAAAPEDFTPTPAEKEMAAEYNLTQEQLQWRRSVIDNECGGDESMFQQEYPSNPQEAFLTTGRPVFPSGPMANMVKKCRECSVRGSLIQTDAGVEFVADPYGPLEIWDKPQSHSVYAIGADTAEGRDPEGAGNADASSAHVGDVHRRMIVAKLSGGLDMDLFGLQLGLLSQYYHNALTGNETNNTSGGAVLTILKSMYVNICRQKIWNRHEEKMKESLGWKTDMFTRELMVTDGIKAVRDELLDIPSRQTVRQMQLWIRDKTGKPTHTSGEHDDDVISILILLQMMIMAADCPSYEGYAARRGEPGTIERPRYTKDDDVFTTDFLAYAGIRDSAEDILEEED